MHPQPENPGQPKTKPASKRRGDNTQEVVEYRDGLGDHHPEGPDAQGNEKPGDGRQLGSPDGVLRVAEDTHEDILRCDVGIDDGGDGNRGDSDSPDHFTDRGTASCRKGG